MKVQLLGVIIVLQIANVLAKRKYKGVLSSEESIENILYYKDCNQKRKNDPKTSLREAIPPPEPRQSECKMFCNMCCGDHCVNNQQTITGRQQPMNERSNMGSIPKPIEPATLIQPPVRIRKRKLKEPLLPPIGGRRDYGFTREDIKGLIAQDEDIKRILKDLVKVTMQKVDLVEMINARKNQVDTTDVPENSENGEES